MGHILRVLILMLNLFYLSPAHASVDHKSIPVTQNRFYSILQSSSHQQIFSLKGLYSTNYFTTENIEFHIIPPGNNESRGKTLENVLYAIQCNTPSILLNCGPTPVIYPYEYLYPEKYIYFIQILTI